jgi:regulator of sigma E protease
MLLAIISFLVVLIPLVIIHELGHFFAAKSVGVTVLEFGVGFPPRAATLFTRGDTEYTLNWLPLGGFVRPYGEDFVAPQSKEEMQKALLEIEGRHIENPKSVFEARPWERIWFFSAGPLFNFVAAFILFIVIGFTGIPTTVADVSVAEVLDNSAASAAGLQPGDVILSVDGQEMERIAEFEDAIDGKNEVTLTIRRGEETIEDVTLVPGLYDAGDVSERVLITSIVEDSPAEEAGLQGDDVVLAVDGESVDEVQFLVDYTDDNIGEEIEFTVARGTEVQQIMVTPEEVNGSGRVGIFIAAAPVNEGLGAILANRDAEVVARPAEGLGEALDYGGSTFLLTLEVMATFPGELIAGNLSAEEARPVSPIGVSQIGGEILEESRDEGVAYPFIGFTALISIALAVTNLLPIPGLDGGRIMFVLIELLRGKPMEPEREGIVHIIGLLFLLSVMVIVIFWDIVDPIDLDQF